MEKVTIPKYKTNKQIYWKEWKMMMLPQARVNAQGITNTNNNNINSTDKRKKKKSNAPPPVSGIK